MPDEFTATITYNKWAIDGTEESAITCVSGVATLGWPWRAEAGVYWVDENGATPIDAESAIQRWYVAVSRQDSPAPSVERAEAGTVVLRVGPNVNVMSDADFAASPYAGTP